MIPLAVSTVVLAASAVSEACPLGREVDLARPVLPWQVRTERDPLARIDLAKPPKVTLVAAVGRGASVVRTLASTELRCGGGRGEATVHVQRGRAMVSVSGFDPVVGECVRSTIASIRFARAANDTLVRVALELR